MSQLAAGEVACFWLDRARDADWLAEEVAAAGLATVGSPDGSDRARLAEQALRLALARAGETAASAATIVTAPRGRPSFADSEIEFSLSHSGTVTVLAIGKVRRLGVDLELGRRPLMMPEVRRQRCADALAACPAATAPLAMSIDHALVGGGLRDGSGNADDRFLGVWTQLEAIAKADGRGIFALLSDLGLTGRPLEVPPPPGDPWAGWANGLAVTSASVSQAVHVAVAHDECAQVAPLASIRD